MAKPRGRQGTHAKQRLLGAVYCIDANVLIHAQRDYPPKCFPRLWENLDGLVSEERLISAWDVYEELKNHEGDVTYKWAKKRASMFIEVDLEIQSVVVELMAEFPKLAKARLGKTRADPFVIATAITRGACVLTHEGDDENENRPKIPYVCRQRGVSHARFPTLITAEGWVFQ